MAFDDDPGYGPERPLFANPGTEDRVWRQRSPVMVQPFGLNDRDLKPMYYKPTMRFYGNGYTVNYRYVAVYRADAFSSDLQGQSANFHTEAFRLSPEDVVKWGANDPRVTVKDSSSGAPRSAVTSIVHRKPAGRVSTKAAKGQSIEPTENGAPAVLPSPDTGTAPKDGSPSPAPDAPVSTGTVKP
jgi:hypothetical protein